MLLLLKYIVAECTAVPAVLQCFSCATPQILLKNHAALHASHFQARHFIIPGILLFGFGRMSEKVCTWACRPDLSPRGKVPWE